MRATGLWFLRLFVAIVSLATLPAAAADQAFSAPAPFAPKATAPEALRLAPGMKSASRLALGVADADEIQSVKQANARQLTKRLQIGIGRDLESAPGRSSESLRWEPVAGGAAAHWEVSSTGAHALRIQVEAARLPKAAEIRVAGEGGAGVVYGPYTAADLRAGQDAWWSPVLEGERAVVEVFLPAGTFADELSLSLVRVSHLFASPAKGDLETLAKDGSQSCEVDLVCRSATDAALDSVGQAVARMTFTNSSGGTSLCTGTLLNSVAGPVAPYFYSAAHCMSTQASASTLTTHWFYDRTACGTGTTSPSYVQVGGGATLLYANATTDVLFLRLNQDPPGGATYAGWNAATLDTGSPLTAVHHPAGDWKKVSLGSLGGFSGYFVSGETHLDVLWNSTATGVTEGGSSGSGIFSFANSQYQLRGGLHGGPSNCTASGADLRDYYSRFDRAYACVASHLNPDPGCSYAVSPGSQSASADPTSGSFNVTTGSACSWAATSNASWITTTTCGTGSGAVSYSLAQNTGSTARTGTITAGGQTFTVTQAAQAGTAIIANSGFESGATGWTQQSTSGLAIISSGTGAHTGSGYAWLGGYVSGTDHLYQDVTIPAGATQVRLQYWYQIATAEGSGAWDTFQVLVQNPVSGATLATLASYTNLNATSGWVQSPVVDLSAYAGQTIRLRFTATNDSSNITSFLVDDIVFTAVTNNYTGLWYNTPAESEAGWGINFTHQGNIVFATLFTYDAAGAPLWLVMSEGSLQSGTTYSGALFRTTGPAFNAEPFVWNPATGLSTVGTMSVTFTAADRATLVYTFNNVTVTKFIQKQVYGSRVANCVPTTGSRAALTNYQDLWYKSPAESEPGWGVNLTHQDDTLFGTLFTYDATGRDLWVVMSAGLRQPDGSYLGDLYQTTGPAFNAVPFTPLTPDKLKVVGTMRLRFSDGLNGTLEYTYNGTAVTKPITRQVFSSPVPACS